MNKIEQYLDNYENIELTNNIYNMYSIKITENKRKRLNQNQFRKQIIKKFNNTCIISGITCIDKLTAAHIIPIAEDENYDIDNGLLLVENLHKTFDKYFWSINPETLQIEINPNIDVGSIQKHNKLKINLQINNMLYANLKIHYDLFKKKIFLKIYAHC